MINDPLSKFRKDDSDPTDNELWAQLIAVANTLDPQAQKGFYQSVEQIKANVDSAEIIAALKRASPQAAVDAILETETGSFASLANALEEVMYDALAGVATSDAFNVAVEFNPGSPQVSQFIQNYVLGQVQQITDQQRALLTSKVQTGLQQGQNPIAVARDIKPYIGLTDNQAGAVDNFRALLESNDPDSLTRELRDHRYDQSIKQALNSGTALDADAIDTMVARYADRSLASRAQTIGRTEAMNALHQSQSFLWQQAADSGKVMSSDLYRYWHVGHDERTCPICKPIPGMNPDGVALNAQFQTPVGPVDGPTMHPNCRCVVFTRPHIASLYNTDPSQLVDEMKDLPDDSPDTAEKRFVDPLSKFAKANPNHDPKDGEFTTSSEVTGYHHGQTDGVVRAHDIRGNQIGHLAYTEFGNELSVNDVHVHPQHRRKGVATAMYDKMKTEFPNAKLGAAYRTDDGGAFRAAYDAKKIAKYDAAEPRDAKGEWSSTGGSHSPEMLLVEHYSPTPGLHTLEPAKAGSGRVGREKERKDRIPAVHVYDSTQPKLEHQFRHDYRYKGSVPKAAIYDIGRDPDRLIPSSSLYDASQLEQRIKAQGYAGFRNSESQNPSIIKLFYPLTVTPAKPKLYRGARFGSPHTTARPVVAMKSWISKKLVSLRDPLSTH